MPAKPTRHLTLTETLAAWIDAQVAKGKYPSTFDLVRTAVRILRSRDEDESALRLASSARSSHGMGRA
ncbi:hypothetical protein A3862_15750 [Methylobacterium sp. XJLW]|jgi:antitoxin ParD1/3/4|uniref:ribbon-helix-helix domain-containing protein n=1 Tax=Methylobacterium sp. XJLW TaxID=739141 RepID=UPI000DAADBB9|nr:type II toxin-antitoxin system ParD family antitoxin [Methylobacterium sp. XJLW]AWV16774.1 hypothetical protein A3862_15750 [Methylobacterium sp. XJLW]